MIVKIFQGVEQVETRCPVCQTPHDIQVGTETGIVRGVPYSVVLPLLQCPRAQDGLEYPAGVVEIRARTIGAARNLFDLD